MWVYASSLILINCNSYIITLRCGRARLIRRRSLLAAPPFVFDKWATQQGTLQSDVQHGRSEMPHDGLRSGEKAANLSNRICKRFLRHGPDSDQIVLDSGTIALEK